MMRMGLLSVLKLTSQRRHLKAAAMFVFVYSAFIRETTRSLIVQERCEHPLQGSWIHTEPRLSIRQQLIIIMSPENT